MPRKLEICSFGWKSVAQGMQFISEEKWYTGGGLRGCGIGINAMSMEPLSVSFDGVTQFHNHVFAFMLLQLDPECKPITSHLMNSSSGNAGHGVR